MPLTKLQFKPGINRENTSYGNEGGWYDGNKVRFRYGVPEKIGGWQKDNENTFLGTCRVLKSWMSLAGQKLLGLGTTLKYYILQGDTYYDITPLRATTSAGDVTFSATNGSSTITATDTSHGAIKNDFVTFSGAATLGGLITATVLNQEYQIASIVNDNSYTFTAKDTSGDEVTANSSDSGNGGGSIVGKYQINVGLDDVVAGLGWGTGTWGRGTWDSDGASGPTTTMRLWSHDNFGEDLIINVRDSNIYYWDTSADTLGTSRAIALSSVSGADSTTPTVAKQILVSDRGNHVIAFGCDSQTVIGTQDPLLIRFSDTESAIVWEALATNAAGDLRISSGSEIMAAVETRLQIMVFTDASLHAMQYLGPPFTFGIGMVSENITLIAPNAVKAVDDKVFWMGLEDFYVYDGRVQKLPCSVRSFVFDDFNMGQKEKVFAALDSSFNEVWWFYPTESSDEIDRYIIYNYAEQAWTYGTLVRTAWLDRGIFDYPLATDTSGVLYDHEFGLNDGSTNPPSAIDAHVESSQIDIGDGEHFVFLRRLIPDISFNGSTDSTPSATFTLKTRNFPGVDYSESNANSITQTQSETSAQVALFTSQAFVRLRGRSFALRVASSDTGVQWRLGTPRVEVRQDGRQ